MGNTSMIQFFEWNLPNDGNHWKKLQEMVPELAELGIHGVWIPPPTKAQNTDDVGYGAYDLWDLGEFEQKGAVRTKYGTRQELEAAIKEARKYDVDIYADIVLNHKAGAEKTEKFLAKEVDPDNRELILTEPHDIEGWTKFEFPGRKGKYSDFKWHYYHFTGVDWDQKGQRKAIFLIEGDGKDWSDEVDQEMGNDDYLMFSDIDYQHPDVIEETKKWGAWIVKETGIAGFRIDAIKHFDASFTKEFLDYVRSATGRENIFAVGESWKDDVGFLEDQLNFHEDKLSHFDIPFHSNFLQASKAGREYDMTQIFNDTLVSVKPLNAVTFVDNHDTQPGCALDAQRVEDWFKPIGYALILLREAGYPCIFYGDMYGLNEPHEHPGFKDIITKLLELRRDRAYGEQNDYFDHPDTIGWVRRGDDEHPQGLAVVICTGDDGFKKMFVGEDHAGEKWIDLLGNKSDEEIEIGEDGFAEFKAVGGSVSAWGKKD
ncbi:hypothetical protein K7432_008771 [Basidiobolus ranarum]|uniref:Glycosyl hydrolase family 13 catalytic domain-containing protein n=1 Tax=Basidiobolus ranarum TaxID=34480 RepID=A0ABR2VY17_9FUNG